MYIVATVIGETNTQRVLMSKKIFFNKNGKTIAGNHRRKDLI